MRKQKQEGEPQEVSKEDYFDSCICMCGGKMSFNYLLHTKDHLVPIKSLGILTLGQDRAFIIGVVMKCETCPRELPLQTLRKQ